MTHPKIRTSTMEAEGMYQASKWLSIQTLLDVDEMQALLLDLGQIYIFQPGQICKLDEGLLTKEQFIEIYRKYIDQLKKGVNPDDALFRAPFSSLFTQSVDDVYRILVGEDRQIIRVSRPVIQLQNHRMHYSTTDHKFRPMIFGADSIAWGIQFSYPQIFCENKTHQVFKVLDKGHFENTKLFKHLQKWIRENTIPTPFVIDNAKVSVPIRIGKNCLSWINRHPQLVQKELSVNRSDIMS